MMEGCGKTTTPPSLSPTPRPRLLVYGSVHYDVIARLGRLPQANDRLTPRELSLAPGGMGGNVAAAFARLGGHARFVGPLATDEEGAALADDLRRDGVDVSAAAPGPARSVRGCILVGEEGERAIITQLASLPVELRRSSGQASTIWQPGSLAPADGPLLEPGALDAPADGCSCPFNSAPRLMAELPPELLLFTDIEAVHLTAMDDVALRSALRRARIAFTNARSLPVLQERLGLAGPRDIAALTEEALIETRGREGCCIHTVSGSTLVPGSPADPIDTTGAGDAFAAAFILRYLQTASLRAAAVFANVAAARSVEALGSRPGVPTAAAMRHHLSSFTGCFKESPA